MATKKNFAAAQNNEVINNDNFEDLWDNDNDGLSVTFKYNYLKEGEQFGDRFFLNNPENDMNFISEHFHHTFRINGKALKTTLLQQILLCDDDLKMVEDVFTNLFLNDLTYAKESSIKEYILTICAMLNVNKYNKEKYEFYNDKLNFLMSLVKYYYDYLNNINVDKIQIAW